MLTARYQRVMIVDEYVPSLIVLSNALRSRGCMCDELTSAAFAIDRMPLFRPEAVLYEWNRRDGFGIGLARRIRAAATVLKPLVIAVSTLDEPAGFRSAEQVDAYLTKPFRVELLDELLTNSVQATESRRIA